MKGIYLAIFGVVLLILGLWNVEVKAVAPIIITVVISISCIIVGLIYKSNRIEICDIFKEIY